MALPPDVRVARDFRVIKGVDTMIRTDYEIASGTAAFAQGEWVVLDATNKASKANGQALATPAQNVVCCWTSYAADDTRNGQADTVATNQVTCISGAYQAETKFFESTGTFTAGFLLVVREDSVTSGKGVLDAVDGDTASAKQIAASIGRVVKLENGVLTYRTHGAA